MSQYLCPVCGGDDHLPADCRKVASVLAEHVASGRSTGGLCKRADGWKPWEKAVLILRYREIGPKGCAALLPSTRTHHAIRSHAVLLGLSGWVQGQIHAYGLTDREVEIIRGIVKAGSDKQAARDMGLSLSHIEKCMHLFFTKMGVKNRMRMALKAERAGLLQGIEL